MPNGAIGPSIPENRLVARSLEQRWEEALRAERQVRDDYDRFLREQPPRLAPEERARIAALSSDLPALWHDPGTTHQDRKEIIRHLVEKVVVHVKNDSEYVDRHDSLARRFHQRSTRSSGRFSPTSSSAISTSSWTRIVALRHEGHTAAQIADCLNREGFSPPKRCDVFSPEFVHKLLSRRRGWRTQMTYDAQLGPARVVVAEAGRADPGVRGKARRLGSSGLAPLPEDARETPVGPLGRQGGVETAPQAGGRYPTAGSSSTRPNSPRRGNAVIDDAEACSKRDLVLLCASARAAIHVFTHRDTRRRRVNSS